MLVRPVHWSCLRYSSKPHAPALPPLSPRRPLTKLALPFGGVHELRRALLTANQNRLQTKPDKRQHENTLVAQPSLVNEQGASGTDRPAPTHPSNTPTINFASPSSLTLMNRGGVARALMRPGLFTTTTY